MVDLYLVLEIRFNFKIILGVILEPLAQIEKESPESQKLIFSCLKRATTGSSF
jgi:hypothetical protein